MVIPNLHSVQAISARYDTGDSPVLVLCSDKQQYICKYVRPGTTISYKLACEYIGALLASEWKIHTPIFALVQIYPAHWMSVDTSYSSLKRAVGYRKIDGVIDITPTTYRQVAATADTLYQLLKIALFDFWIANEDRTYNNANLLYHIDNEQIISIDYGGVLNNVTFDFPLSQLTPSDSILGADIFSHIATSVSERQIGDAIDILRSDYKRCISRCRRKRKEVMQMPKEWAVPIAKVENKLTELLSYSWLNESWNNFIECLNGYVYEGK